MTTGYTRCCPPTPKHTPSGLIGPDGVQGSLVWVHFCSRWNRVRCRVLTGSRLSFSLVCRDILYTSSTQISLTLNADVQGTCVRCRIDRAVVFGVGIVSFPLCGSVTMLSVVCSALRLQIAVEGKRGPFIEGLTSHSTHR